MLMIIHLNVLTCTGKFSLLCVCSCHWELSSMQVRLWPSVPKGTICITGKLSGKHKKSKQYEWKWNFAQSFEKAATSMLSLIPSYFQLSISLWMLTNGLHQRSQTFAAQQNHSNDGLSENGLNNMLSLIMCTVTHWLMFIMQCVSFRSAKFSSVIFISVMQSSNARLYFPNVCNLDTLSLLRLIDPRCKYQVL